MSRKLSTEPENAALLADRRQRIFGRERHCRRRERCFLRRCAGTGCAAARAAGSPRRRRDLSGAAPCSSSCTGLPISTRPARPAAAPPRDWQSVTLPWRSSPQMPSATAVQQNLLLPAQLFGAPALLGPRQHLPQRRGRRFHRRHGLAVLAQAEAAIELQHRQHLVARAHRHRPARDHLLLQRRRSRAGCGRSARGRVDPHRPSLRPCPLRQLARRRRASGPCCPGSAPRRCGPALPMPFRTPDASARRQPPIRSPRPIPARCTAPPGCACRPTRPMAFSPTIWLTASCSASRFSRCFCCVTSRIRQRTASGLPVFCRRLRLNSSSSSAAVQRVVAQRQRAPPTRHPARGGTAPPPRSGRLLRTAPQRNARSSSAAWSSPKHRFQAGLA